MADLKGNEGVQFEQKKNQKKENDNWQNENLIFFSVWCCSVWILIEEKPFLLLLNIENPLCNSFPTFPYKGNGNVVILNRNVEIIVKSYKPQISK